MKIIQSISELRQELGNCSEIGLVPTMGALHEGHLSLIKSSVEQNETTVVSIYVNPTQFGPNDDFTRYPRTFEQDCEHCKSVGADFIFCPTAEEIRGEDLLKIQIDKVTDLFEGPIRPGHFVGVATIVAQLFLIVQPSIAYFGLKDLQQCAVIRELVKSLFIPIELKFIETIREPDGLAMSSRNRFLAPEQRQNAVMLHQFLQTIAKASREGNLNTQDEFVALKTELLSNLPQGSFLTEYLEIVDPWKMQPSLAHLERRVIIAAKFPQVRLIDNVPVF